jgi:hypothetical protein
VGPVRSIQLRCCRRVLQCWGLGGVTCPSPGAPSRVVADVGRCLALGDIYRWCSGAVLWVGISLGLDGNCFDGGDASVGRSAPVGDGGRWPLGDALDGQLIVRVGRPSVVDAAGSSLGRGVAGGAGGAGGAPWRAGRW